MDPASIASAAVALIGPYLAKAAGKAAEGIGQAAVEQGGKLFDKLRAHFAATPAAAQDLADLQAAPDDSANQGAVQKQLRRALEADPGLLQEVAALVAAAGAGAGARFSVQAGSIGNVTQAGSVQTINIGTPGTRP